MRATDKVIQKNQNTAKKSIIGCTIRKWRPKNQFSSRDIKWETTFPKEFFLEIWLIIEDCKYNYTAEIKFEKSYSIALLWGKHILNSALKMLIYANQQNLCMVDANFLPPKVAQGKVRQSQGRAAANNVVFSR